MGARMERFVYRARARWVRFACRWFGHPGFVPTGKKAPADSDVMCVRCQALLVAEHYLTAPSSLRCYLFGHNFREHPDGYIMHGVHCVRCDYTSVGARRLVGGK